MCSRPALPDGPYLVVGLGRAGLAAIDALVERFGAAEVRAWDDAQSARSRRAIPVGGGLVRISERAGALEGIRTVVKSPGIPLEHPLLASARDRGLPIIDELELGWRLSTQPMVAVTGTNGKSTTVALIAAAMQANRMRPALAGNVESDRGIPLSALPRTHEGWVLTEVSSYQACGLVALLPQAAVFTNLTPDHLHWHGSMKAYGEAKRRVFVNGERAVALAVLNVDDPFGRSLGGEIRARGGRTLTYGTAPDADYRIMACDWTARDSRVALATPSGPVQIKGHLPGAHNASNVAAALALADGLELERARTIPAIAATSLPPGRLEPIDAGQPFRVFVDFAHSPDSLTRVLTALRAIAAPRGGRLIVVLGMAPSGERVNRLACGRAARAGCDHLILCAWSLKGEPPLIALSSVLAGARETLGGELEVMLDRRRAIARGLSLARSEDVVVILGRGPLTSVRVDAHSAPVPFDDREVAREILEGVY
jgi:UDP-N-acetylmuramoyl-L-alanyl-D-glutamate--2,6-diaminopimelate ligase